MNGRPGVLALECSSPARPVGAQGELARRVFEMIIKDCATRLAGLRIENPGFALRRMEKRLGSCAPSGKLLLDPRLVEASTALIEFVIVHELCHQRELNHGPAFYRLMDKALPDWRERERRLLRYEFSV